MKILIFHRQTEIFIIDMQILGLFIRGSQNNVKRTKKDFWN